MMWVPSKTTPISCQLFKSVYVHGITAITHYLTLASFKVLRKYDLSVLGSYHKLISHVKNLNWRLVNDTPALTTPLKSSDLQFSLNPSCYATTAL